MTQAKNRYPLFKSLLYTFPLVVSAIVIIMLHKHDLVVCPNQGRLVGWNTDKSERDGNTETHLFEVNKEYVRLTFTLLPAEDRLPAFALIYFRNPVEYEYFDLSGYDYLEIEVTAEVDTDQPITISINLETEIQGQADSTQTNKYRVLSRIINYKKNKSTYKLLVSDFRTPDWWWVQHPEALPDKIGPPDLSRVNEVFIGNSNFTSIGKKEDLIIHRLVFRKELYPVILNCLVGVLVFYGMTYYGLGISVWRYAGRIIEGKQVEKRKLQLAELKVLRSRMNYHFMSNAFNSLQGLFFSDSEGVDQYLGKFSNLMRFTLEYADQQQILLQQELEYVKLYCDIEQLRVGEKFTLQIKVDETLKFNELMVPALSLQPFVENAIWHGIMPKEQNGKIMLNVLPNDSESYKIIIEDNGVGINYSFNNKPKSQRKSFGIQLIIDRFEVIKRQTQNKFNITIEDLAEKEQSAGTRVTMTIPYQLKD